MPVISEMKILLVEDDADDAEMTLYTLSRFKNVEFTHVCDGKQAIHLLFNSTEIPDLVLLDIRMPGMDGVEVLRKIRLHPSLAKLPVVAFISSAEGKHYLESFHVKADGYLLKPVTPESFLKAVVQAGFESFSLPKYAL